MAPNTEKENLRREINAGSLALATINMVVGSGIFVLPAIIAAELGAAAVVAYLGCGVLVFLLALCFAEVGSKSTKSGGIYTYIEEAFGPFMGFLSANIYLIGGCMASDAALANALADTLQHFFPWLGTYAYRLLFFLVLFGVLAWLNISSVKNGLRFVMFTGVLKIAPIIVLLIFATPYAHSSNLTWQIQPTAGNVGPAALLLFFAFMGFEVPLSNGGEIKNPARTVPLGTLIGVSMVLMLYIAIQLVTQGILGSGLGVSNAPLAAVAGRVLGNAGTTIIIVVTVVAILGSLSGELLSIPRILFAGARDGLMPRQLAKVHPRFATPYIAIVVYVFLDFVLAISGGFKQLAIVASAASLLLYMGVALAGIKLRRREAYKKATGFTVPGGIIIPVLAVAIIGWLLSNVTRAEVIALAVFVAVFSVIYLVMIWVKKKQPETKHPKGAS